MEITTGNEIEQTLSPDLVRQGIDWLQHANRYQMSNRADLWVYLSSSDPLEALRTIDVSGKNVMMVAGSMDPAQVFALGKPSSMTLFDRSVSACCMAELKAVALQTLDFWEWQHTFHTFNASAKSGTMMNMDHYRKKLRPRLSEAARLYFDAFDVGGPLSPLLTLPGSIDGHFALTRRSEINPLGTAISSDGIVQSRSAYQRLTKAMAKIPLTIRCALSREVDFTVEKPDVLYISNIGIDLFPTINEARTCIANGAESVLFTGRTYTESMAYMKGKEVRFGNDTTKPGPGWKEYGLPEYREQMIVPGTELTINDTLVRGVGFDASCDFPLLLSVDQNCEKATTPAPMPLEVLREQVRQSIVAGMRRKRGNDAVYAYTKK